MKTKATYAVLALLAIVAFFTVLKKEWWWKRIAAKWETGADDRPIVTAYPITEMFGIWRTGRFPDMDVRLKSRTGANAQLADHELA